MWCHDALTFTRRHHLVIERYPLQVHISALIFTPQKSLVAKTYHSQVASTLPAVLTGIPDAYTHVKVLDRHRPEKDWLQFSPDGRRLLTLGSESHMQLWDVKTGSLITHMMAGEVVDSVHCATYSRNGNLIASGGAKGNATVSLWDGVTGKLLQLLPRQYRSTILSVVFVMRDQYVVSASEDGKLRRWPANLAGKKEYLPDITALSLDDHRVCIDLVLSNFFLITV
jgi:WD40 repeat protein